MFSGNEPRPLEGVRVVELATFLAVPGCGRFFADMGADVVKVEPTSGDMIRWVAANEGLPDDPLENASFDLENANKRSISVNVKSNEGRKILFQLLDHADIFLTNWRPGALKRQNLGYEALKERYPALVYASVTGYGEEGPDKDLPGYDSTAFLARGGFLGSLYDLSGRPMNIINGLGDHQVSYMLAAGIMAAYVRRLKTGKGEKVSVNLLHASIFDQGLGIQGAQYKETRRVYPTYHYLTNAPMQGSYETRDGRWIYVQQPQHNYWYPIFMKIIGREDLADDPILGNQNKMIAAGRQRELYEIICEQFKTKTLAEWLVILRDNDIAHAPCQNWDEVLADPQAWANQVFYKCLHDNGKENILVRTPVDFEESPAPGTAPSVLLGAQSREIVEELGYTAEEAQKLMDDHVIREWHPGENPFKY